ncbi:MAG: phosphate ABC transporter permease PstA [Caldilineaceae bacterium]
MNEIALPTTEVAPTAATTFSNRALYRRHKFQDRLATAIMWGAALFLVAVLFVVVFTLLYNGLPALSWNFLTTSSSLTESGAGIGPQLWVSIYVLVLTLLFTTPLGLGAAIYLSEYATPGPITAVIHFCTEALASVPSIVFGVFGSIVFLTLMGLGFSVLSGALTLTILNLPLLVRVAEDAIRSVPRSYREGSLALGATKWETIRKVVLPTALPGIFTAIVLTGGRIVGETAPLILTTGATISPNAEYSLDPMATGATLAVHIWVLKIVGIPGLADAQQVADGTAAVLLLLMLLINLVTTFLSNRIRRRLKGAV